MTPKALLNKPQPHDLGLDLKEAFDTLSSSRQHGGMGDPLPIAVSEMLMWCMGFEITSLDDRAAFIRTMQKLDAAYLAAVAERRDKHAKTVVVNPSRNP